MKNKLYLLLIPLISSFLLAGCSFEDLFAKIATTNEEQGARETFVRDQAMQVKQKRIDEKKSNYQQNIKLEKVNESDNFDAIVFYTFQDNLLKLDIEAILPDAGRQIYEAWLRSPQTKESINLGALQYNQIDDYSLVYQGEIDPQVFSNIILSREANPDDQLETILMTGSLTTSTP